MMKQLNLWLRSKSWLLAISGSLFCLVSCGYWGEEENQKGKLLAEVEDARLYESDLESMFSGKLSKEDSIQRKDTYVKNWIKEKLLYYEALDNLPESRKNKEQALQSYYESLIRYEYEQQMLDNYLDTAVNDSTIRDFYEDNQERFHLDRPVLKFHYLVFQDKDYDLGKFEKWFKSDQSDYLDSLYYFAVTNASSYSLEDPEWKYYNNVPEALNLPNDNRNRFLEQNRFHSQVDSSGKVFVMYIVDYKKAGEVAPLAFEKPHIREILLNRSKKAYLEKQEKSLYEKGIQSNRVDRYD